MPEKHQLQSYQFATQRVVSALVQRETDPARSPFRRLAGATLGSVMVAILALAGVGLFGLLKPGGNQSWKNPDQATVVIEKETGARFVYFDGQLHPVPNYASALLVAKGTGAEPVSVSKNSLSEARRGTPMGIAGAPDALPGKDDLLSAPWTVCSRTATDRSGQRAPQSVLYVGSGPTSIGTALSDGGALLSDDDGVFLIWRGRRHKLAEPATTVRSLWGARTPTSVAPSYLNAIPSGRDIGPPVPASQVGRPSRFRNEKVGKVFVTTPQGAPEQYYVAVPEGLAAISRVQASVLRGSPSDPVARGQKDAERLSDGQLTGVPILEPGFMPAQGDRTAAPLTAPELAQQTADTAVCASFRGTADPTVTVNATVPDPGDATSTKGHSTAGRLLADRVVVPAGHGVLAAGRAGDDGSGQLTLVTDTGTAYPVPGGDVQGMLGYAAARPTTVATSLLYLVPTGPALDPATARKSIDASD